MAFSRKKPVPARRGRLRKETTVTTAMVFVMVILAAIFFLVSDTIINWLVDFVLGIGR